MQYNVNEKIINITVYLIIVVVIVSLHYVTEGYHRAGIY